MITLFGVKDSNISSCNVQSLSCANIAKQKTKSCSDSIEFCGENDKKTKHVSKKHIMEGILAAVGISIIVLLSLLEKKNQAKLEKDLDNSFKGMATEINSTGELHLEDIDTGGVSKKK